MKARLLLQAWKGPMVSRQRCWCWDWGWRWGRQGSGLGSGEGEGDRWQGGSRMGPLATLPALSGSPDPAIDPTLPLSLLQGLTPPPIGEWNKTS